MAAAVVDTVHAPPAITFLHAPQLQIPTAVRLTESYETVSRHCDKSAEVLKHLSAKGACISSVLRDFHLFDLLTQGGTITSTVFTGDADFLGAFCLVNWQSILRSSVDVP